MPKRIEERLAFSGGRVDRTDPNRPYVRDVLLCGATSANKRRYKRETFSGDRVKKYNGVPVFLNHGRGPDGRPYQEQIGLVENARQRESDGMPVGDIAVNPHKPCAVAFMWDAEHQPKACSMSHVIHAEATRAADGWEDVNELVEAESVDVISARNAATTKGLFEGKAVPLTVRQLCEVLVKHPKVKSTQVAHLKKLGEMDGMDALPSGTDAAPADDAEAGDAISAAFESAIMAIVKEALAKGMDKKGVLKTIGKLLDGHGDAKGGGSGKNDDGSEDDDGDPTTPESKRPSVGTVLAECKAKNYTASGDDLAILCDLPTVESRAQMIDRLVALANPGNRPSGASRRPGAGSAGNQPVKTESNNGNGGGNEPPKIPKFDTL